ncbi:hypothetical protein BKH42_02605 [Helicobacter sp. 13S00482-2]|uniref:HAMP domain-containing protein n=1 Tax=Helicobacter sp. 13S00482-2 TaxID=1476200 RepID=UPI000BA7CE40|nr:HAMP domain-containing protein [Helicobacter sp. 13S00482-2]PAF54121.1 hypothetical protein BKH42_02605 [Helicobacter sp. 13S00482-2]
MFITSLRVKFSFFFGMAFLFVIALWYQSDKIITEKQNERAKNETMLFIQSILPNYTTGNLNAVRLAMRKFGYIRLIAMPKSYKIIESKNDDMLGVKIFRTKSKIGFSVNYFGDNFIVAKDIESDFWEENRLKVFFLPIMLILGVLYVISFTLINPLNKLGYAIKEFAKGKYDRDLQTNRKDEIGDLIRAFNFMGEKIFKMLKSRELILRNIGHELKTPLAKMKLILALNKNKTQEFKKLERYVGDMQKISDNMLEFERVNSGNIVITNEEFLSETLIFEALSSFSDEENRISVDFGKNFSILGDLRLLSVALKNLVENGLKYSRDGRVHIQSIQNKIIVKNKGDILEHSISYYLEPFCRDSIHSAVSGHGLGLSIVSEILSLHHYELEYRYENDYHIFGLNFDIISLINKKL